MHRLSINLTDSEKMVLDEAVRRSGLNISNYVKRCVFEPAARPISEEAIPKLGNILKDINRFKVTRSDEDLYYIEQGAKELCQILLS